MTLEKLVKAGQFWFDVLFKRVESSRAKWAAGFLLTGLFVGGLLYWGFFLDWFNNRFDIQDWHVHVGPYLDFLSKALRSGQFPMYADSPYMIPAQYLARQNRPFSPQILLLYFMDPAAYVLANVWIFYAFGFWGLLLIRQRYQLSIVSFLSIFLLFNLNGHIVAHLGSGHFEWVGYFLLPFYVLLVLKMVEGEATGWKWLLSMSIVMLGILLQGAAHFFIYCMAFLFLLGIFQPRFFSLALKAVLLSGLAGMIRILPPAIQFAGGTGLQSLGGFESVLQVLEMLISPSSRGYWEQTYYLGALGFGVIVYFGIIKNWAKDLSHRPLYLSSLAMLFFSVGSIYLPFFNSDIPFLDSQRAPTRFLIVPLVFLITLAGIRFQSVINDWDRKSLDNGIVVLFGMGLMAYDLLYNSRVWSLDNYSDSARATDILEVAVANYSDPSYVSTLIIGLACTAVTLATLAFLAYKERKKSV
ncbi:MAG: hypothetical protein JNM02_02075 [Anaerolineales bacterium]|nr:hypothetical protein [Anaerolineales bacterium]